MELVNIQHSSVHLLYIKGRKLLILQHEVQDLQSELHAVADAPERTHLKETTRQECQTDLQGKPYDPLAGLQLWTWTEPYGMRALQMEEAKKKEKRLLSMYEQWKLSVRKARNQLKSDMAESKLWLLIVGPTGRNTDERRFPPDDPNDMLVSTAHWSI